LLRAFAEEKRVKAGALINGSRVALTGQAVAPSLFAVMAALGKERVVKRLEEAGSIPIPVSADPGV
jgi:glutamyl-tRNA synthetase